MHMHAHPPHKVLFIAILLTLSYGIIEALGGWYAGSLTLLGDAGHMVSDALALAIAAFAASIAIKPASYRHTFGLGRAEVIAAWLSSLFMLLISLIIIIEAIRRFQFPKEVHGTSVMVIAFIGMLMNIYVAWLLSRSKQTLNVRAAMLHVLSDVLGSIAALVSGVVICFTHWMMIDPILSILIALLIMFSSIQLFRESLSVLMEGVPRHLDVQTVRDQLLAQHSIISIHNLHIWTLSSGSVLLSAHVMIKEMSHWERVLTDCYHILRNKYHIHHVTLQPELNITGDQSQSICQGNAIKRHKNHVN